MPSTDPSDDSDESPPSNESDSDRSIFADLLDEIDERRSTRTESDIESCESDAQVDRSNERLLDSIDEVEEVVPEDSLDKVRELLAEKVPHSPRNPQNTSRRDSSSGRTTLYIGIALIGIVLFLLPGTVVAIEGHIMDTIFAPPPTQYVDANDTLYLEAGDAAYLSRIFQETTHEVAYCGLVTYDTEQPRLEIWMANTVAAGPEQIEFTTNNCPSATQEVLLHTHPNGVVGLSEQDKQTLQERPEKFICVQGGPLTTEPGAELKNLACYYQMTPDQEGLELARIPIVIMESDTIIE